MTYKIKRKKKKMDEDDKWLNNWYKLEKQEEKNPYL